MDGPAKSRIMSSEAKKNGGYYEKGSWPARAQSAADRNANKMKRAGGVNYSPNNSAAPLICLVIVIVIVFVFFISSYFK